MQDRTDTRRARTPRTVTKLARSLAAPTPASTVTRDTRGFGCPYGWFMWVPSNRNPGYVADPSDEETLRGTVAIF